MTEEKVKEIKRSFRLYMNGVTSQSMRDKGAEYHINWGVSIGHLHEMAAEYGKDYDLAVELWKENIRECKILATLLMPAEKFESDIAMLWIEQLPNQEIAEYLSINLLQHTPYASDIAMQLLAERQPLPQICGYNVLGRLFMQGCYPNERDINEFIDQAQCALASEAMPLRNAAYKAILRFADLGEQYDRIATTALRQCGVEL